MTQVHNSHTRQDVLFNAIFDASLPLLKKTGALFIGDYHDDITIREYLMATLAKYKEAGVTTFYLEALRHEDQDIVAYRKAGIPGSAEVLYAKYLPEIEADSPGANAAMLQVVDVCHSLGIRVVGMNDSSIQGKEYRPAYKDDPVLARRQYLEECDRKWSQVIAEDAPNRADGSYLIWAGATHTFGKYEAGQAAANLSLEALPAFTIDAMDAQTFKDMLTQRNLPLKSKLLLEEAPYRPGMHMVARMIESPNQRHEGQEPAPDYLFTPFMPAEAVLYGSTLRFFSGNQVEITEAMKQALQKITDLFHRENSAFQDPQSLKELRATYEELAALIMPEEKSYLFSKQVSQLVLQYPALERRAERGKESTPIQSVCDEQDILLQTLMATPSQNARVNTEQTSQNLDLYISAKQEVIAMMRDKIMADNPAFKVEQVKGWVITGLLYEDDTLAAEGNAAVNAGELEKIKKFMEMSGITYQGISKGDNGETLNFSYNNTPYSIPIKTRGL